MTGAFWFIVTEDNNGVKVDDTLFYDDHDDATDVANRFNAFAALRKTTEEAVRSHGIDGDHINSDTIDDAVHPDVFGEAVNAEQFEPYEAAEISDVIHEAISTTYWAMVDEANGIDINPTGF
jgi:hypothetical protein